jgi:hypothetical protein
MTQDAKGRGNVVPPLKLSATLEFLRIDYERTGNPIFVWNALIVASVLWETLQEEANVPDQMLRFVPDWCWQYLIDKAHRITEFSMLNGTWGEKINNLFAEYEPLAKDGNEDAKWLLDAAAKYNSAMPKVELKAKEITRNLPLILGFVDGAHSNAFYNYWLDEKKKAVARAWDEAQREGKTPKEILDAVSEMTGIYDEPYIRRIVKEAKGKALPRRRSNKPKAPKGKKD